MSSRARPESPDGAEFPRSLRKMVWLNTGVLVVAAVSYALLVGSGWSWPYLVWGFGAGVFSFGCIRGLMRFLYRGVSRERAARARRRQYERYRSLYISMVLTGGVVGVLAASMQSPWPDILFMLATVVATFPMLLMLPRFRRIIAEAPDTGDGFEESTNLGTGT